jgi:hypothetical protein
MDFTLVRKILINGIAQNGHASEPVNGIGSSRNYLPTLITKPTSVPLRELGPRTIPIIGGTIASAIRITWRAIANVKGNGTIVGASRAPSSYRLQRWTRQYLKASLFQDDIC